MMGLFNVSGLGGLPKHVPGEVGIHFGRGAGAASARQVAGDWLAWLKLRSSGWRHVHLVNLMFYEWVQSQGGALAQMCSLLPHPVKPNPKDKIQSRRDLGLPLDGTIIGIAGLIDYRKAVAELLTAFRRATDDPQHRLLLAGPIEEKHRRRIDGEFRDLVDSGRLLLVDRFLDADSNQTALSAMDVVCTPYPRFAALSGVLLEGLAAGRPILTNRLGWCRRIVEQFDAGWTCDVLDPEDFTRGIRTAFERCASHRASEATARLLAFHEPQNFAAGFLQRLRAFAGLSPITVRSWSWVVEGLGQRRPSAPAA
jgi:glycosyltransferase involved in cell wall biosynthesis